MKAEVTGGPDQPSGRAAGIARRLEKLMAREAARCGGRPPAYREIADRINQLAGRDVISRDTVRNLHLGLNQKGQASNPTVETLDWLGRGFGISAGASYFLDDVKAAVVDEQLDQLEKIGELRRALGNDGVINLLQRASALSNGSLNVLLALADNLRQVEERGAERGKGSSEDD
ncbi:hypothetical protein ACFU7Y_16855 [Kitasatospora sp. NPDC057542]|uniref:hypothetical protein n=1 Tax=Streptomycetaceae TaxID=2062 RepID=UPI001CCB8578|nr:hypothetical protein [Streptomyces sp. LS1784]